MNDLFYLGIIIPTVITIILFLIFIYCWFLQKARKEVLTKKYDPHGKMRRLGMSMEPPPPPKYCQASESLLPETGEDNCAYDVSRSPSTEQEGHGQPMYHTYHDSGISNCLSPCQDGEPLADFAYRACPDSGFSLSLNPGHYGQKQMDRNLMSPLSPCEHQPLFHFGQSQHSSASQPVLGRRDFFPDQMRPHQILTDQIQVHTGQHGYFQQQRPLPPCDLQPASVHPNHGVCYGDDTRHPQGSQHCTSPQHCPKGVGYKHQQLEHHQQSANRPAQSAYRNSSGSQLAMDRHACSSQAINYNLSPTELIPGGQQSLNFNYPMKPERLLMNIPVTGLSKACSSDPCIQCLHLPLTTSVAYQITASSVTSPTDMSHSYSNKPGLDTPLTQNTGERPDSQASQSSTTDSEDSGFRSSHCAAHHKSTLSKQGNPLLKPTRRIKNKNTKGQQGQAPKMTPMVTLNPNHLQMNQDNVLHTPAIVGVDLAHRSPVVLKQATNLDSGYFSGLFQKPFHNSPTEGNAANNENWPPQSTNDRETVIKQNIDLSDISTHLSWNYQQDTGQSTSGSTTTTIPLSPTQSNGLQQSRHQGIGSGQMLKITGDQHMELVGYSVV